MSSQGLGLDPDKGAIYIPPRERYPDYRAYGDYSGFDPMDYCAKLRERVANGELSWEEANTIWREYADSVAAVWVDQPRPGPCGFSDGEASNPSSWRTDAVPYYDDGWMDTVPTTKGQTVDEYFESFDPATWFGLDDVGYAEPLPGATQPYAPLHPELPNAGAWFDEGDAHSEAPRSVYEASGAEGAWPESAGDPRGDARPSSTPNPRARLQPVRPMMRSADGVIREIPITPFNQREDAPPPEAPIELSPYMSLPASSGFSIKGDSCGCASCRTGGPCK